MIPDWLRTQPASEKEAQKTCQTGRMQAMITKAKKTMFTKLNTRLPIDLFLTIAMDNYAPLIRTGWTR